MHRFMFSALCALAVALPASASSIPNLPRSDTPQPTTLKPISIRDYERAAGLRRRGDSEDFSDLDLQTQSQLVYGSPGNNGQLLLANMTLYAEDGLQMVMMERFEGLTSAVDCKGDDGTMSLTFSSQNAFKYALQQWEFINESDEGRFLLIANHAGCGPDDQRQPYLITKITEDTASLTTFLAAQTAPWSEVASTYEIDFGHVTPYKQAKRGLGDIFVGNFDKSEEVTFSTNAGEEGKVSEIYTSAKFSLNCINCFVAGSWTLAGHIATHHWGLTDLTLTATPKDFKAALELEAKVTAQTAPESLQYEKELLNVPIPGAGISITGIFSLGATLSYDVGVTSSFQGTADVNFGLATSVPNGAQLLADIRHPDSSSAAGFGGGSLDPIFDVKELSASITLGAYGKPKIAFGIELIKIGTVSVDIGVKLPQVDVTLTAGYKEAGLCPGNPSTTGVDLKTTVTVEVDLDITAKLGGDDSPSYSKPLFTLTEPVAAKCFPLQIPGLEQKPASTVVPTAAPTVVSTSAQLTASPSVVYSASGVSVAPIVNGSTFILAPSGASVPASTRIGTAGSIVTGGTVVRPSASGGIPSPSGGINPPYPYPSSPSSVVVGPTGTGSNPTLASGTAPLATSTSLYASDTTLLSSTTLASATKASSGVVASGTGVPILLSSSVAEFAPLVKAKREDCVVERRFGGRVLVC